jgi:lysyl-tRNA synthetase class 2
MKRLLAVGAPDLYQVAHVFREGERGRSHNPEFTMIEWYRLGVDDRELMTDVEHLVAALLEGHVRFEPPVRVTYSEAFEARLGVDPLTASVAALRAALRASQVDVPSSVVDDRDALLDLGHVASRRAGLRARSC